MKKVSIIAPMFNESENLNSTLSDLKAEMQKNGYTDYEIIYVNDGSVDDTWENAKKLEENEDKLKVVGYLFNQGRGKALRTGIEAASGEYIVTIDFDLTYDASHITRMLIALEDNSQIDAVLASAYMPGGKTIGVDSKRLFISKLGNYFYRFAFSKKIYTSTCIVRAYRAKAIKSIYLDSDGKEIHLEIISKLLANGYKLLEIPATLTKRTAGNSKFKFKSTSISHLLFLIHEKPFLIFGFLGLFLLLLGFSAAAILTYTRFGNNPEFNATVISRISSPGFVIMLFLFGFQFIGLGFLGVQNSLLKKELFKLQKLIKADK